MLNRQLPAFTSVHSRAIEQRFQRLDVGGLAKHARIHECIAAAISAGELQPGQKLPPERDLSSLLCTSLGTTQKALNSLARDGFIVRQHGKGTFVAAPKRPMENSWHYRFLDPQSGTLLAVYPRLVGRDLVRNKGPWSTALGDDPVGFVRIRRKVKVAERFNCYSEIYLRAGQFIRLLKVPAVQLEGINLKSVFARQFDAPTIAAGGKAFVMLLPAKICTAMGITPSSWGMRIDITAISFGQRPISFQQMYVPSTDCPLELDFTAQSP